MIQRAVRSQGVCIADQCRNLEFGPEKAFKGKRLVNHTIRTVEITVSRFCENLCYMEPYCVSINLYTRADGNGNYRCELNNATHEGHEEKLIEQAMYSYHAAESNCVQNPCKNNATCQSGFTKKGYRCLCTAGFEGPICERDVNECVRGLQKFSSDAFCTDTKGSCNCTCKHGFTGNGRECKDIDECVGGSHSCSPDAYCNNTKGSYNCTCKPGFLGSGRECEDINECLGTLHTCSPHAFCNNTKGSYSCTCKHGLTGNGRECKGASSCKEIYDISNVSGVVTLLVDSQPLSVFCHMGNFGCGDGGWTPVMKIDGRKTTFHYDAHYWKNHDKVNLFGGETGFDEQESKLPTYWNTSFSKICLGMKINKHHKFIVINRLADSLHSLIADDQYRNTSLGRDEWKALIGSNASLQHNCNREGFNVFSGRRDRSKVRIGIISNDQNDCYSCNSLIGFGTGSQHNNVESCGNEARHIGLDNGQKSIKAMGYILVQ
ncbi:fibrillin-1-like [Pocillopora verrucosa]|uniref:fibrillin-1-like n=1 Tax=Pocillopora verrucosa TaxID=203993 RepID=UPI00333F59C2